MNYERIYNLLVSRAKDRPITSYTENHHIIPVCLNGSDSKTNMVKLTAREHFVAHQLLLKIYPKEYGLIKAVNMMCIGQEERKRANNRMYAWLRERFSKEQSRSQTGEGNSQHGTMWIHSLTEKVSKKISKEDFPTWEQDGWQKGRKMNYSEEQTNELTQRMTGVRSIFNEELQITKKVTEEQLHNYLNNGWVLGRKNNSILNKNHSISLRKAKEKEELEELYLKYKNSSHSLLLFLKESNSKFKYDKVLYQFRKLGFVL